MNQSLQKDH